MARIDTLPHFLTDVADAIREKKGSSDPITIADFDTEIENLPSGGGDNEISNSTDTIYEFNWQDLIVPNNRVTISSIFRGCAYVKNFPKIIFNNNVTNASNCFMSCTNMNSVDMSNWNISNIIDFSSAFYTCTGLTGTNNFVFPSTTCNGTDVSLSSMFYACSNLVNLDLSDLHINNIRVFSQTFRGCTKLKTLDIRNFKLSTTTTDARLDGSFWNCSALEHLDIRGFDFVNVQIYNKNNMLNAVPTACEIIVKDAANKTWFNTNFASYTNVKTVAEYEG